MARCFGLIELEVHKLIGGNVSTDDAVVYTDRSVHVGDMSGRGFSVRILGKIVTELSGDYITQSRVVVGRSNISRQKDSG